MFAIGVGLSLEVSFLKGKKFPDAELMMIAP
jgi:hypothetical protein